LIAEELFRIKTNALGISQSRMPEVDQIAESHGLDPSQRAALRGILFAGCGILTGGPGTGKTTTLRAILDCIPKTKTVALCAPTGKAARVMRDATGRNAKTIHSLLSPDMSITDADSDAWHFLYDSRTPLPFDVVIADECSMIDHKIAAALLQA